MIAVWRQIEEERSGGKLDLYSLMDVRALLQRALKDGPNEVEWAKQAYAGLVAAPAIPGAHVSVGF